MAELVDWLTRWSRVFHSAPRATVHASEITNVSYPVHTNQRVEKSFTIRRHGLGDDGDDASVAMSIHRLQLHAPGLTVVRVRSELLSDVGPDVVARVRVSSDAREHLERLAVDHAAPQHLRITYTARAGTSGHLVTEIDVPRPEHVAQVVAKCRGDVVVAAGVVGTAASFATPALVALLGARLFVSARRSHLRGNDLLVACIGSGSVNVATAKLKVATLLASVVVGGGTVRVDTKYFASGVTFCAAVGGGSSLLTAARGFHSPRLLAYQRGAGNVGVAAFREATVTACSSQRLCTSGGGSVDVGGILSARTRLHMGLLDGSSVVFQLPSSKLALTIGMGCATSKPNLVLTTTRFCPHLRITGRAVVVSDSDDLRGRRRSQQETVERVWSNVPTIEQAFETPVPLEKPSEGWLTSVVLPVVTSLLRSCPWREQDAARLPRG